eukprot:467635_1
MEANHDEWDDNDADDWGEMDVKDQFDLMPDENELNELHQQKNETSKKHVCDCTDISGNIYCHPPFIACDTFKFYLSDINFAKQNENIFENIKKYEQIKHKINVQFLLDAIETLLKIFHLNTWITLFAHKQAIQNQLSKIENFKNGLKLKIDNFKTELTNKERQEIIGYTRTADKYMQNLVEYCADNL